MKVQVLPEQAIRDIANGLNGMQPMLSQRQRDMRLARAVEAAVAVTDHRLADRLRRALDAVMALQWSGSRDRMDALHELCQAAEHSLQCDETVLWEDRARRLATRRTHSCDDPLCAVCGHPWAMP